MSENNPKPIFDEKGGLIEDNFKERFGLGIDVGEQKVKFGQYEGSVAEMLADSRCPVGEMVETANRDQGVDGVMRQFELLTLMDSNFRVDLSAVKSMGAVKKK